MDAIAPDNDCQPSFLIALLLLLWDDHVDLLVPAVAATPCLTAIGEVIRAATGTSKLDVFSVALRLSPPLHLYLEERGCCDEPIQSREVFLSREVDLYHRRV